MARCAQCGKHTSWLRRVRIDDQEFCGASCALLRAAGRDAGRALEIARQAASQRLYKVSVEGYLRALALGIPGPRDAAYAKWEYADVLWRQTSVRSSLDAQARAKLTGGATHDLSDVVRHYVGEAESDLKRHLRSAPDDLDALRLLHKITVLLDRPTTAVEEQMKRLEIRQALLQESHEPPTSADKTGVSFENKCLQIVRAMGFRAELTKATADGGIDIIAFQDQPLLRGKYVIQCKDWTNAVGEPVLRDLLGAVSAEDAVKGILITSSDFTQGAKRFAEGKRLELIDGRDLEDLTAQSQPET